MGIHRIRPFLKALAPLLLCYFFVGYSEHLRADAWPSPGALEFPPWHAHSNFHDDEAEAGESGFLKGVAAGYAAATTSADGVWHAEQGPPRGQEHLSEIGSQPFPPPREASLETTAETTKGGAPPPSLGIQEPLSFYGNVNVSNPIPVAQVPSWIWATSTVLCLLLVLLWALHQRRFSAAAAELRQLQGRCFSPPAAIHMSLVFSFFPLSGIIAWLSLLEPRGGLLLSQLRSAWEVCCLHCFMLLMLHLLGGPDCTLRLLEQQHRLPSQEEIDRAMKDAEEAASCADTPELRGAEKISSARTQNLLLHEGAKSSAALTLAVGSEGVACAAAPLTVEAAKTSSSSDQRPSAVHSAPAAWKQAAGDALASCSGPGTAAQRPAAEAGRSGLPALVTPPSTTAAAAEVCGGDAAKGTRADLDGVEGVSVDPSVSQEAPQKNGMPPCCDSTAAAAPLRRSREKLHMHRLVRGEGSKETFEGGLRGLLEAQGGIEAAAESVPQNAWQQPPLVGVSPLQQTLVSAPASAVVAAAEPSSSGLPEPQQPLRPLARTVAGALEAVGTKPPTESATRGISSVAAEGEGCSNAPLEGALFEYPLTTSSGVDVYGQRLPQPLFRGVGSAEGGEQGIAVMTCSTCSSSLAAQGASAPLLTAGEQPSGGPLLLQLRRQTRNALALKSLDACAAATALAARSSGVAHDEEACKWAAAEKTWRIWFVPPLCCFAWHTKPRSFSAWDLRMSYYCLVPFTLLKLLRVLLCYMLPMLMHLGNDNNSKDAAADPAEGGGGEQHVLQRLLQLFCFLSLVLAMWGLAVVFIATRPLLKPFKIGWKFSCLKALVFFIQLLELVAEVLQPLSHITTASGAEAATEAALATVAARRVYVFTFLELLGSAVCAVMAACVFTPSDLLLAHRRLQVLLQYIPRGASTDSNKSSSASRSCMRRSSRRSVSASGKGTARRTSDVLQTGRPGGLLAAGLKEG
ncbi:hypothetical protein cyc_07344 [Cyclospora cayetanensis]|uniref:Transmembrane protein n=1 Tax=Cyclospora cayetanensis TaxID=88456 RepID=A0A1D3CSB2_9EIME|nr:hypothetical protein cyc_07344 [Cyclospora cayetanensis]